MSLSKHTLSHGEVTVPGTECPSTSLLGECICLCESGRMKYKRKPTNRRCDDKRSGLQRGGSRAGFLVPRGRKWSDMAATPEPFTYTDQR